MEKEVIHLDGELKHGYNTLLNLNDQTNNSGMNFSVLTLNELFKDTTKGETVFVLLSGEGTFSFQDKEIAVKRESLFNENPYTFLLPKGTEYTVKPSKSLEFAVISTEESICQEPKVFSPKDVSVEKRGLGLLDNASYRLVKTVFDYSTLKETSLVVGEVVNQPGRWSSYPPHHHPQHELYFYRFLPDHGYGFSQLGDHAVKVKQNSLVHIKANIDHPQVSAPGYAMWYLWVVRHLPGNPYTGFEFDPQHEWTLKEDAKIWSIDEVKTD